MTDTERRPDATPNPTEQTAPIRRLGRRRTLPVAEKTPGPTGADLFASTGPIADGPLRRPDAHRTDRVAAPEHRATFADTARPRVERLHDATCAKPCPYGGRAGHERKTGISYADLVDELRSPVDVKAPVEAKVTSATWASLAASVAVAALTVLLQYLDVIPGLVGGDQAWVGILVLVLGPVLTSALTFLKGYQAPHTSRTDV